MSITVLARSSLKQFSVIYAEVRAENVDIQGEELETLMWEKIVAGMPAPCGNKIPSHHVKKFKYQLPYMPDIINYIGCPALKPCGGLYIPCCGKQVDEEQYCASCAKHEAKYGTLSDRGATGTYTDPSDKHEISYGTWLAKNELTIEDINKEIAEEGFTFQIPASFLTVNSKRVTAPKRRPGRPGAVKKTKVNEDGSESPMGTSLDGVDVKVVIDESDATISSDEEEEKPKKKAEKKTPSSPEEKAAKKAEAEEKKRAEKELAKGIAEAKKAAKAEEKAAKERAKSEKDAESPKLKKKKEEKTKEEKPKEEKPKKKSEKKKKDEEEAHEEESDEVVIDGKEYMMVGNKLFDDSGTLVGSIHNGKAEFIHA